MELLTHILEGAGLVVGLLYLWWEYHADSKVWLASLVMPMLSMWLYFSKGLYADFAINIYYLVMALYGLHFWTSRPSREHRADSPESPARPILHTPLHVWCVLLSLTGLMWAILWWVLSTFTDSTVPLAHAFTTALSMAGLWMLARKYIEQWWVWMVVDAVSSGLYLYKGLPFYCALYGIYTLVCIFGYRKWESLMHNATQKDSAA